MAASFSASDLHAATGAQVAVGSARQRRGCGCFCKLMQPPHSTPPHPNPTQPRKQQNSSEAWAAPQARQAASLGTDGAPGWVQQHVHEAPQGSVPRDQHVGNGGLDCRAARGMDGTQGRGSGGRGWRQPQGGRAGCGGGRQLAAACPSLGLQRPNRGPALPVDCRAAAGGLLACWDGRQALEHHLLMVGQRVPSQQVGDHLQQAQPSAGSTAQHGVGAGTAALAWPWQLPPGQPARGPKPSPCRAAALVSCTHAALAAGRHAVQTGMMPACAPHSRRALGARHPTWLLALQWARRKMDASCGWGGGRRGATHTRSAAPGSSTKPGCRRGAAEPRQTQHHAQGSACTACPSSGPAARCPCAAPPQWRR
jgi:hypothetical protein